MDVNKHIDLLHVFTYILIVIIIQTLLCTIL